MQLQSPIVITSRLMPGVMIGQSSISLDHETGEYHLDLVMENGKRVEHSGSDLTGPAIADPYEYLHHSLGALLSFMSACGESFAYGLRTTGNPRDGEHTELFPLAIAAWCNQNEDELSMLSIELEETERLITE